MAIGTSSIRPQVGRAIVGMSRRVAPSLALLLDSVDGVLSARGRQLVTTYALLVTFVIVSTRKAVDFAAQGYLGIDLRIYRTAAGAVLTGDSPWQATGHSAAFAATPPTVAAYIPAALLPETIAEIAYLLLSVAAALYVIQRFRLPIWWILFPPIFESILVLNPDVLVIALLVAGPRIAALAVPLKVYAVVPLLLERNWASARLGVLLAALAGPAWIIFLAQFGTVFGRLSEQSLGGLSAWGTWLMLPTVVALISLRGHGASWLTVPALWPYTQLHYSCIALPVVAMSPMLAVLFSFGIPLWPPIAIVLYATQLWLANLVRPYRWAGAARTQPAAATLDGRTLPAPSS